MKRSIKNLGKTSRLTPWARHKSRLFRNSQTTSRHTCRWQDILWNRLPLTLKVTPPYYEPMRYCNYWCFFVKTWFWEIQRQSSFNIRKVHVAYLRLFVPMMWRPVNWFAPPSKSTDSFLYDGHFSREWVKKTSWLTKLFPKL